MKKILTLILFGLTSLMYPQVEFKAKDIIIQNELTGKLTIEMYSNKVMYRNEKCNFPKNITEQKFCIFFNLNSKEELADFFNPYEIASSYRKDDYLNKMNIYNNKSNFYTLDSKYVLDYGISKDIFIKYINTNEVFPKPIYASFYIQDFLNQLIVKDMGENLDLGLFLISSNTYRTIAFLNKSKNNNIDINSLTNKTLDNVKNQPNKNSLYDLIDEKYSPFFNSNNETTDEKKVYKDIFSYNFKKTFNDVINGEVLKKNKVSKKEIIQKYNIPIENLDKDSLSVKEVIRVTTMNNDFQIIKFHNAKTIIKTNYEVLNNDIIKSYNLLKLLTILDFEIFINFYSDEDSKKHPEINKLKPLVQDSNGILNIEKLSKVIKENQSVLSKYLDN